MKILRKTIRKIILEEIDSEMQKLIDLAKTDLESYKQALQMALDNPQMRP